MWKAAIAGGLVLTGIVSANGQTPYVLRTFFQSQVGLSEDQIAMIDRGRPVAKVITSNSLGEIIVFGAVFVDAPPAAYVDLALDVERLRRSSSYLNVRRFSSPPVSSDLDGFSLEPGDVRNLKHCRPGKCAVQLPAEAMRYLRQSVNWSAPDLDTQINERMRSMALDIVRRYQTDGNRMLGSYHDMDRPFEIDTQLRALVGRSEALPVYLPQLSHYLLDYPDAVPAGAQSVLYWERVSFGLKPTLRLNHAIAYQPTGPMSGARVVVVKQLFASHYFQLALDLTACVPGSTGRGFYLVTLKGSAQQGLTGWKGALLRLIVVSRTRSAQEKVLVNIKQVLEETRQAARTH